MHHEPRTMFSAALKAPAAATLVLSLLLLTSHAFGQQYVGRFEIYAGYMYLDSPQLNLLEPGVHLQAGYRYSRHISLGFDFSRGTGDTALTPAVATTSLVNELNSYLTPLIQANFLPSNYVPSLPFSSVSETFAAGPEFPFRRWNRITPYIRPSIGAIHEVGTAHPNDTFTKLMVSVVAPSGVKQDWTAFYGVGGGVAFNLTRHFSLIVQGDLVHDHLYNDLLKNGRNTLRISVGPGFQFGKDVEK